MSKNIVITAGGTIEKVDDVRNITNMSTGKLGSTICNTILEDISEEIEKIYYVTTKNSIMPEKNEKIEFVYITGVYELKKAIENLLKNFKIDYFIHSMAVSDYTVEYVSNAKRLTDEITKKIVNAKDDIVTQEQLYSIIEKVIQSPNDVINRQTKISSVENNMIIKLKQAPKIISFIKQWDPNVKLIGFKLLSNVEEEELISVATNLLKKNNCDYVIANDLSIIRKGTHKAFVIDKNGVKASVDGKNAIAQYLKDIIKTN